MPRVFIGMPVYNGERFLREAIDSLRAQTFTDWKMLISDDASTDASRTIVEEYIQKDSRISYVRQEKNIRMFSNFKFLLDKADCDYFMWAAQDDLRRDNYLKICIEHLEQYKNTGFATTRTALIDSFGRILIEEFELTRLSGKPSIPNVARYVLQPEILGKCNLMYGLFRTTVARETWRAYPQRNVWGQDYMFSLALISRFEIYVSNEFYFEKRLGGYSSLHALTNDKKETATKIEYRNPKDNIFPFRRFIGYFKGHMEALTDTPYRLLVAVLLLVRLPRSFFLYLKERNYKKFITR